MFSPVFGAHLGLPRIMQRIGTQLQVLMRNYNNFTFTEEFVLLKLSPEGHKFALLNDDGNQSDAVMIIIHLDIHDVQVFVTKSVSFCVHQLSTN